MFEFWFEYMEMMMVMNYLFRYSQKALSEKKTILLFFSNELRINFKKYFFVKQ